MKKSGMMIEQDLIRWHEAIQAHAQADGLYSRMLSTTAFSEFTTHSAEDDDSRHSRRTGRGDQRFRYTMGMHTPKLDVRGVVFKENKILMVRELRVEGGNWTCAGRVVDINETLE